MDLNKIPRPVLIIGVFAIGVFFFTQIQKPHTKCDSQLELLRQTEDGSVFAKQGKKMKLAAFYDKAITNCKMGMASPGACYGYFRVLRKLHTDLLNVSDECGEDLMDVGEVKRALVESLVLMVQIAWGEAPPEAGRRSTGSLEAPELALYCGVKDDLIRFGGQEAWQGIRAPALSKLPGEEKKFMTNDEGKTVCLNCDTAMTAEKALGGMNEVFNRSLLSLNCANFH